MGNGFKYPWMILASDRVKSRSLEDCSLVKDDLECMRVHKYGRMTGPKDAPEEELRESI